MRLTPDFKRKVLRKWKVIVTNSENRVRTHFKDDSEITGKTRLSDFDGWLHQSLSSSLCITWWSITFFLHCVVNGVSCSSVRWFAASVNVVRWQWTLLRSRGDGTTALRFRHLSRISFRSLLLIHFIDPWKSLVFCWCLSCQIHLELRQWNGVI